MNGTLAQFSDPAKGDETTLGGVDAVIGEGRYTVSGNGKISLDELIEVAESMFPRSNATGRNG